MSALCLYSNDIVADPPRVVFTVNLDKVVVQNAKKVPQNRR